MAYTQFVPDNMLQPYGTNQLETCIKFATPLPEQLVGMVPTTATNTDCVQDPCYTLCVFDEDKSSFLYDYPDTTGTATFELQKYNGSVWVTAINPMGAGEGTLFPIGTFPDYPSYAGFEIDWALVYANHGGVGKYRFVVKTTDPANDMFSLPFDLKENTCDNKNLTVKIEMVNQGSYFNLNYTPDNKTRRIYDLINMTWYDSVRYYGVTVKGDIETEETNVNYNDYADLNVYSEDRDTYDVKIPLISQDLIQRLYAYGLRSEDIKLTDNNTLNQTFYEQLPIVSNGAYTFERQPRKQVLNTVSIPIKHRYARRYKKS